MISFIKKAVVVVFVMVSLYVVIGFAYSAEVTKALYLSPVLG